MWTGLGASIFFVIFIQSVNLRFCISDRLTKSFPGAEQCTPAVVPKKPEYDDIHFEDTMAFIREQFSSEEISIAFQLLERWIEVRRQVQERRRLEEEKQKYLIKWTSTEV